MDDFPAIEFPPAILENIDTVRFLMAGPLTAETTRGIVLLPSQLQADGHTEDEVRGAWYFARSAGYTESTGLGADRLTEAGRKRATEIASG